MAVDLDLSTGDLNTVLREMDELVRSRHSVIAVDTHEELRFKTLVHALAQLPSQGRISSKPLWYWSRVRGLEQQTGQDAGRVIDNSAEPMAALDSIANADVGIFVLFDFGPHLAPYGDQEEPLLARRLRELSLTDLKGKQVTVFLVGPTMPRLTTLEKAVHPMALPLPDEREVASLVAQRIDETAAIAQDLGAADVIVDASPEVRDRLVGALLGLTEAEIGNALARAAIRHRGIRAEIVPTLLEEKRIIIRKSGSLTFVPENPDDVLGGYGNVRTLLQEAAVTFQPAAQAYGVRPSKGLLLVGPPGTGKSLIGKIAGAVLGRPVVTMDMGSVIGEGGGIVGQASVTMRRNLQLAQTLKCVLVVNEFEKGVGGGSLDGRSDGGETARALGIFLDWMQDQREVFVLATANDVRDVKPELLRQGRFSATVWVDLPNEADRSDIFRVHVQKRLEPRGRGWSHIDFGLLARNSEGFSGAEIEAAVEGAILDLFMESQEQGADPKTLATDGIARRLRSIKPIGQVKAEEIANIRDWARAHLGAVGAEAATLHQEPGTDGPRLEF